MKSLALFGLAASVLLSACGQGAATTETAGPVVVVDGTDAMKFEPAAAHVKAGEPVTIAFKNKGVIVHDYISSGAEKNVRLANVLGGREARGVFQASKPGTYQVLCQQVGHQQAGMVGTIVVE